MRSGLFILLLFLCSGHLGAQILQPGFDKQEYIDLLKVSAIINGSLPGQKKPSPDRYRFVYRSPDTGLQNQWQLWMRDDGLALIGIRGTTPSDISWLENFYAAMVPASGTMMLARNDSFDYRLATNPNAAVHIGWLTGMAFLSKTIMPRIDSLYKAGHRDMIIMGHSQGAAIACLLTAYLQQLQSSGRLPKDIRLKNYGSGTPKPGNLAFAMEYESANRQGWSYQVVNAADWVPETPVAVQTMRDFNPINPFSNARAVIRKQPWPKRWGLLYAYLKLNKYNEKAERNYRRLLGRYLGKQVEKKLPGFAPPPFVHSNNYVRVGTAIILQPDEEYYRTFIQDPKKIFVNHAHGAYLWLAERL